MTQTITLKEDDLIRIKKELTYKCQEEEYRKIRSDLAVILEGQEMNQKDLRLGFIGLAAQNSELLELNKKLNHQLETVVSELNVLKKKREEKMSRKEARANRKRLPKRDPVTPEIYQALINGTEADIISYNGYTAARLRVGLCLLTIIGIRVNELLPLKVHQLKTLLAEKVGLQLIVLNVDRRVIRLIYQNKENKF